MQSDYAGRYLCWLSGHFFLEGDAMKRNKELVDELTKLYDLLDSHQIEEAKREILWKLSECEMTPQHLAEQKEINDNKRLCYAMLTAYDKEHYPEQNRLFYIAYQKLKRCLTGQESLDVMAETMEHYTSRFPIAEKNYRYITISEFSDLLDKHRKWLNFSKRGKQLQLYSYDLSGIDLKDADLSKAVFHDCLFKDSDLSWSNFELTDFANSRFEHCIMFGTRFVRSHLQEVNFEDCNLRAANFDGAELDDALFTRSDLSSTFFRDNNCMLNIDDQCQTKHIRIIETTGSEFEHEM